jgi:hypothetical protein
MRVLMYTYQANKATNANGGLKWIQKGGGYWSECKVPSTAATAKKLPRSVESKAERVAAAS